MNYEPKHGDSEYGDLTLRYETILLSDAEERKKFMDIIFDHEEQITLLSAANGCYTRGERVRILRGALAKEIGEIIDYLGAPNGKMMWAVKVEGYDDLAFGVSNLERV